LKFPKDTEAILLISSGKFHGIPLAVESNLPVYVFDLDKISKISEGEINDFVKRKKSSYLNFLHSEKVGILISTKPGQENLQRAISLKPKLKNKNSYFFIASEIDRNQFENFPDIQSWINTACPRLDFDASLVDVGDL
jgi:diphthamide biosynthesis enzyme Dph1/Dph2-like protein